MSAIEDMQPAALTAGIPITLVRRGGGNMSSGRANA